MHPDASRVRGGEAKAPAGRAKEIFVGPRQRVAMKGWLTRRPDGGPARSFGTATYVEKEGWDSAGAPEIMARLLAASTASDGVVKAVAGHGGWDEDKARDALVVERQPEGEGQSLGKFGEVLHAEILEAFQGMTVVAKKYRYNPAPDAPMHGADLIAVGAVGGGAGERIVYVETKLRTVRDGQALVRARAGLARISGRPLPASLAVELNRLHKGDPAMFRRLARAALVIKNPHFRIGAVFEESAWSDSYLDRLARDHDPDEFDMAVDIVRIGALRDLVRESYKRVR